jgi:methylglutamate dehydrogenase subunit A
MDMTPDGSPIIDKTPMCRGYICRRGLELWRLQGRASIRLVHGAFDGDWAPRTRWRKRFRLDRFRTGHTMDEEGTGSQHNLH